MSDTIKGVVDGVQEASSKFVQPEGTHKIKTLVLDAGPLITQPAAALQQYAKTFFTTPGVLAELKDESARQQLAIWGDLLKVQHPKQISIKKVSDFAKLTGDYAVLSANDIHIIALAHELECESNGGDWRLRKYPGEQISFSKPGKDEEKEETIEEEVSEKNSSVSEPLVVEAKPKKPRRRGGKKQREKREAQLQKELEEAEKNGGEGKEETVVETEVSVKKHESDKAVEPTLSTTSDEDDDDVQPNSESNLTEEYDANEDDGEWITPENLQEEILKDSHEKIAESGRLTTLIKVALTTGDFACQNVSMQMGLNLMNSMSGKQIKRVRNYMYRCHACFRLTPIPKDGTPKHFCPKCGGATLLRCAVSVDTVTGRITPHLKANFQWHTRGDKFSLPSPQSKQQRKLLGNGGYQHNKDNRSKGLQNEIFLREDQKEYQQAVKDDMWQRRQNEKVLQEWIGGGSADNYMSPFSTFEGARPSGVRVGRGRFANANKGKRK